MGRDRSRGGGDDGEWLIDDEAEVAGTSAMEFPSRGDGEHYLAKCVFKGGAILQAVRGRLRSPFSYDIVFGKETSIELVFIRDDGTLQSICEQNVYGIIRDLVILPSSERLPSSVPEGTDLLAVLSDSPFVSILSFCPGTQRFVTLQLVALSRQENPRTSLGRMLAVDSHGYFLAVSAYEDRFAVLPVYRSAGNVVIDKFQITYYPSEDQGGKHSGKGSPEVCVCGTIWSLSFISKDSELLAGDGHDCLLAVIMHRKGAALNDLLLFGCNIQEKSIHVISQFSEAGTLALCITEAPHLSGFAVVFGLGCIFLMDLRDPTNPCCIQTITLKESAAEDHSSDESSRGLDVDDEGVFEAAACALLELRDAGVGKYGQDDLMSTDSRDGETKSTSRFVSSWGWESTDSVPPKLALCDDTGEVFVLDVNWEYDAAVMTLSDCFFGLSPCKVLLWVKSELIVAIVEMGDGMVLKLEDGRLECIHLIQNTSPILDLCLADCNDEKQDQMIACCGMNPEGSVRTIRSGISVEILLKTAPIYEGITGMWALQISESDPYHSFLVISFVEETRILTVGLNFADVTESVGFRADVCTLACGLVSDGILAQIHGTGVRISLPAACADRESNKIPISASWFPHDATINLGAVGHNLIVVATSNPCFIFLLGFHALPTNKYEIYEIRNIRLQNEISCISIPKKKFNHLDGKNIETNCPPGFDFDRTLVVGTHKPSVEIVSILPGGDCRLLAVATISVSNKFGSPPSGCIPENVKFLAFDRFYVLAGLRNGMLLRYEWPTNQEPFSYGSYHSGLFPMDVKSVDASFPVPLQLVAFRHIGVTPVFLVPLHDLLDSDIIVLCDRPWLLQTARHSLAFASIPFPSATHATSVNSYACPQGILFASENSLHLVEVIHSKRHNVEKFCLEGSCRKVLYHKESKTLLVMRRGLFDDSCLSDICCLDPHSGTMLARFRCESGEIAKSMQIIKVGNEQVLVVGTSRTAGKILMPSGESESSNGRLIVISLRITGSLSRSSDSISNGVQLDNMEAEQLQMVVCLSLPGAVLSVCSYLDRYVLASAGSFLCVCGFLNDNPHRLRKLATMKSRFTVTSVTAHSTRIAVGDCRDGILFYTYQEEHKKLELLYSDPVQRLVADCSLLGLDTVVASDRRGLISMLSSPNHLEDNTSPERNLRISCSYYLGETIMSIRKGSLLRELSVDDASKICSHCKNPLHAPKQSIVCGTMLGSVVILVPVTGEEHKLLEFVQARLANHPLTSPILGNDHAVFRRRGSPLGVPTMLDGDMLSQFLELTCTQQAQVLGLSMDRKEAEASTSLAPTGSSISIDEVIWLLEQVNYALS